jgi:acetyl-CoA carboxylase carboxyl transferase beta subunit/acetyl-CoA carboxylase carboxyl transferase alpha subunit
VTATMPAAIRETAGLTDWIICPRCRSLIYGKRMEREYSVCPDCQHHARLTAHERIGQLLDPGSAEALETAVRTTDHADFTDTRPYADRLAEARQSTGLDEAVVCVRGRIEGYPVIAAVMDFRFLGGSLGTAVGEMITLAAEVALAERVPLLIVTASGGARMQEGALSLMQMAKTSQALGQMDEAGILTISLVTDPTYGGVAASFATLCDVIIAEPRARLGFAGPRVIRQTIRQQLPKAFQEAESLLANGLIDDIGRRAELRPMLGRLLAFAAPVVADRPDPEPDLLVRDPNLLPAGDAWSTVRLARDVSRPTTLDYVGHLIEGFQELRGDRIGGDCPAVVAGLGRLEGRPVVVIGMQKGHEIADLMARNFGMATPAGYRKAARLMRLAAKVGVPVVTLIDTPGAYPGVEAEAAGQAVAIAENLRLMASLPVPVVAVVTGEGGSGGALALAVANRVLMFSGAVYSVISPEGCAAILWNDPSAAPQAAEALRPQAADLLRTGVLDGVIPEPDGGTQQDPLAAAAALRGALLASLDELATMRPDELVAQRRSRFRAQGTARPGVRR